MVVSTLLLFVACEAPPPIRSSSSPRAPSPTVEILPSARALPVNGLGFELEWSTPMRLGPHRLQVLDESGRARAGQIGPVQWDASRRRARFTPTELEPGHYLLRIEGFESTEGGWFTGQDHAFEVLPADVEAPDGHQLTVVGRPSPASTAPLVVTFPEPMHHTTPEALTALAGPTPWSGQWSLDAQQQAATFTPAEPWPAAPIRGSIGAGATDLAGNPLRDRPPGLITPRAP